MRPSTTVLALASTASFALAQSSTPAPTTVSLFLLNSDPQSLVASVVSANPSATTYYIACPPDADSNDCGYGPGATITYAAPSAWQGYMSAGDFSYSWSCDVQGSTSAVCMESAGGGEANFPGQSTETYDGTDILFNPVVVTAGQEKLTAAASASASVTESASAGASTSAGTGSLTTVSGTKSTTSVGAGTGAGTGTRTGGAPSATENAGVRVLEKVVVVVAAAAAAGAGYGLV